MHQILSEQYSLRIGTISAYAVCYVFDKISVTCAT